MQCHSVRILLSTYALTCLYTAYVRPWLALVSDGLDIAVHFLLITRFSARFPSFPAHFLPHLSSVTRFSALKRSFCLLLPTPCRLISAVSRFSLHLYLYIT
jgi:hypothetical protein